MHATRVRLPGVAARASVTAARRRPGRRSTTASAAAKKKTDYLDDVFYLKDAPLGDLLPSGPWRVIEGGVCAPSGFKAAAFKAGLRKSGSRADCALIAADEPAISAGAFTQNVVAAAPVLFSKRSIAAKHTHRAVIINAGQANAATGEKGMEDALLSAETVARALGLDDRDDVLVESTGVIGKRIKMPEFMAAIPELVAGLESTKEAAAAAATAMCTTDLARKTIAISTELPDGRVVKIGGMGKGSGMIHPNMATMLGVVTCDAPVEVAAWREMTKRACQNSYNQISVDGDTSTNDTVVCLTSGKAGGDVITAGSPEAEHLEAALTAVHVAIAKSIAWDGEGATVLLECNVLGAENEADARVVARSVVCSSLAKSAVFGRDPNWGRLAAAAGYSGIPFDQENLAVSLGPHALMRRGQPLDFDEAAASAYLTEKGDAHGTVVVTVSIGDGPGSGSAWGCDLSYDYVKINAEYTT
jgi:glutamate N-acetyltransferase/amino-acid N-acetyltransferase